MNDKKPTKCKKYKDHFKKKVSFLRLDFWYLILLCITFCGFLMGGLATIPARDFSFQLNPQKEALNAYIWQTWFRCLYIPDQISNTWSHAVGIKSGKIQNWLPRTIIVRQTNFLSNPYFYSCTTWLEYLVFFVIHRKFEIP